MYFNKFLDVIDKSKIKQPSKKTYITCELCIICIEFSIFLIIEPMPPKISPPNNPPIPNGDNAKLFG